jgi:hypothetical protein
LWTAIHVQSSPPQISINWVAVYKLFFFLEHGQSKKTDTTMTTVSHLLFFDGLYSDVDVIIGTRVFRLHKHILTQKIKKLGGLIVRNQLTIHDMDETLAVEFFKSIYDLPVDSTLEFDQCVVLLNYCRRFGVNPIESVIQRKDFCVLQISDQMTILLNGVCGLLFPFHTEAMEKCLRVDFDPSNDECVEFGKTHGECLYYRKLSAEMENEMKRRFRLDIFSLSIFFKFSVDENQFCFDSRWIGYKLILWKRTGHCGEPLIITKRFSLEKANNKFFFIDLNKELLMYKSSLLEI